MERTAIIEKLEGFTRKNDIVTRGICRLTETLGESDEEIQLILFQLCEMLWENQKHVEDQLEALRGMEVTA